MEQQSYSGIGTGPVIPPTGDEKTMATLSHALTIFFPILAPLIIYLIKKDDSAYVAYHAKESLNFQITVAIIAFGLIISIIGLLVVWLVGIVAVVFVIIASISASEGKLYKYPFAIRIIK